MMTEHGVVVLESASRIAKSVKCVHEHTTRSSSVVPLIDADAAADDDDEQPVEEPRLCGFIPPHASWRRRRKKT